MERVKPRKLHRRASHSRITEFLGLALASWLLLPGAAAAFPYEIEGSLNVAAEGAGGNQIIRSLGPLAVTTLADQEQVVGAQTAHGDARYFADLATGTLGAFAFAENGCDPGCLSWTLSQAEAQVRMQDTLAVVVPAGYYEQGVYAELRGVIEGSLWASSPYDPLVWALLDWEVKANAFRNHDRIVVNDQLLPVEAPVSIDLRLVGPGESVWEQTTFEVLVSAKLETSVYPHSLSTDANAGSDFYGTLRIDSFTVPQGVSWTSASGVFLPEPANAAQIAAALAALFALRRRTTHRFGM